MRTEVGSQVARTPLASFASTAQQIASNSTPWASTCMHTSTEGPNQRAARAVGLSVRPTQGLPLGRPSPPSIVRHDRFGTTCTILRKRPIILKRRPEVSKLRTSKFQLARAKFRGLIAPDGQKLSRRETQLRSSSVASAFALARVGARCASSQIALAYIRILPRAGGVWRRGRRVGGRAEGAGGAVRRGRWARTRGELGQSSGSVSLTCGNFEGDLPNLEAILGVPFCICIHIANCICGSAGASLPYGFICGLWYDANCDATWVAGPQK